MIEMLRRTRGVRAAALAVSCVGLLALGACGNDEPAAPGSDPGEVDVFDDEDLPEEEEPESGEVVTIKADPLVDPTRELPRVKPPEGITVTPRPDLPDSGSQPGLPTGPLDDVAGALAKMAELHAIAAERVAAPEGGGRAPDGPAAMERFKKFREALARRNQALELLVNLGGRYIETVGAEQAEPLPRFHYGHALATLADRSPKARADLLRQDAIAHLSAYLDAPEKEAEHVADAEFLLGATLLKTGAGEGGEVNRAVSHLVNAGSLLLNADRKADAARAAHFAIDTLILHGREEEALAAASKMGADSADFGPQTGQIQRLLRRAGLHPGAVMPDFDGLTAVGGDALSLAALRGGPVIVHLFQTARVDGKPSASREVDTVLVPLARKYGPKGLNLIGGCLDLRLSEEQLERIRANWEEWGIKERLCDGSLEEARAWCAEVGMDWPFHYDGKWTQNALASHLGLDRPYAFLLDAEGKVVWRGEPPFLGLEEALAGLVD